MSTAFQAQKYEIEGSAYRCRHCHAEIPCEAQYFSAVFFQSDQFQRLDYCLTCWEQRAYLLQPLPELTDADSALEAATTATEDGGPRDASEASAHESPEEEAQSSSGAKAASEADSQTPAEAGLGEPFAFWRARRPPEPDAQPKKMRFDVEMVFAFFRNLARGGARQEGEESPSGVGGQEGRPLREGATTQLHGREAGDIRFVFALLLIRKKVLELVSTAEKDGREWLKIRERKDPDRTYWVANPNLDQTQLERVKDRIGELLHMQL